MYEHFIDKAGAHGSGVSVTRQGVHLHNAAVVRRSKPPKAATSATTFGGQNRRTRPFYIIK